MVDHPKWTPRQQVIIDEITDILTGKQKPKPKKPKGPPKLYVVPTKPKET